MEHMGILLPLLHRDVDDRHKEHRLFALMVNSSNKNEIFNTGLFLAILLILCK